MYKIKLFDLNIENIFNLYILIGITTHSSQCPGTKDKNATCMRSMSTGWYYVIPVIRKQHLELKQKQLPLTNGKPLPAANVYH